MGFFRWIARKKRSFVGERRPEDYWVERGDRIVGFGDLEAVRRSKQLATFEVILEHVKNHGIREVADLGANFSLLGQLLYDRGFDGRYVALENNGAAVARAAKALSLWERHPQLVRGNIRALPFVDRAFECTIMKDVLEHMEDFREVFTEAARVTQRYLLIGCFLPWSDDAPHYQRHRRGFYLNRYRRADVVDLARSLGFSVAAVTATQDADGAANEVVIFERSD